jgi:hypothetical protein
MRRVNNMVRLLVVNGPDRPDHRSLCHSIDLLSCKHKSRAKTLSIGNSNEKGSFASSAGNRRDSGVQKLTLPALAL